MRYLLAILLVLSISISAYADKPRFKYKQGTIEDNITGLVWLADPDCFGEINYWLARHEAISLEDGICGLNDKSSFGDWRLPTVAELHGVGTDPPMAFYSPVLDDEWTNPFSDEVYWTIETWSNGTHAMVVNMETGNRYGVIIDQGDNYFTAVRDK